jgi:hypothetical protein
MRALGTFLHATSDTATAMLHTGSIATAVGAAAAIYTQSLRYGLIVGVSVLVFAATGFGFSLWRTYGSGKHRFLFRRRQRMPRPA